MAQTTGEKIALIFRCINGGDKEILELPNGDYSALQAINFEENKDAVKREVESRLQYELYGEYPLSNADYGDYVRNIKPVIKGL